MEKLSINNFETYNKRAGLNKLDATKINKNEIKNKYIELTAEQDDLYSDILNENIKENNGVAFSGSDYEAKKLLIHSMEVEKNDEETITKKVNRKLQDLRDQEDDDLSAELWREAA